MQGGGTQMFAVLRSSSSVKVDGQAKSALTFDFAKNRAWLLSNL